MDFQVVGAPVEEDVWQRGRLDQSNHTSSGHTVYYHKSLLKYLWMFAKILCQQGSNVFKLSTTELGSLVRNIAFVHCGLFAVGSCS